MKMITLLLLGLVLGVATVSAQTFQEEWNVIIHEDPKSEVVMTYKQLNDTFLEFTIDEHPDSTTKNGYKWNMALCEDGTVNYVDVYNEDSQGGFKYSTGWSANWGYLPDYGMSSEWCFNEGNYGYTLFSSGSKNQFPTKFRIEVPSHAKDFTIYAGTGSTQAEASKVQKFIFDEPDEQINVTYSKGLNWTNYSTSRSGFGLKFDKVVDQVFVLVETTKPYYPIEGREDILARSTGEFIWRLNPLGKVVPYEKLKVISSDQVEIKNREIVTPYNKTYEICADGFDDLSNCAVENRINTTVTHYNYTTVPVDVILNISDGTLIYHYKNIFDGDPIILNTTGDDWGAGTLGTNWTIEGTGVDADLVSNATRATYISQVFNSNTNETDTQWANITFSTFSAYNEDLGDGSNDIQSLIETQGINVTETNAVFNFDNSDADESGNSISASRSGATFNTDRVVGSHSLNCDGTNDRFTIPDSGWTDFDYNEQFAIAFWVKHGTGNANSDNICSKWTGVGAYPYTCRYRTGGSYVDEVNFQRYDGTNSGGWVTSDDLDTTTWHHILYTRNESADRVYLYVDGKRKATASDGTVTTTTNGNALRLCERPNGANDYKGKIDEFIIIEDLVTAEEAKRLYEMGALVATIYGKTGNQSDGSDGEWVSLGNTDYHYGEYLDLTGLANGTYFQYKIDADETWTDLDSVNAEIRVHNVSIGFINGSVIGEGGGEPPADPCDCPTSDHWEISDGSICEVTTNCNIIPNSVRVLSGGVIVKPGGALRAGGCYVANDQILTNQGGALYCGT